jgi:TetR/AcrR family transcriptional regulator
MFEALIDFSEDSVFGLINKILEQVQQADTRCERIIYLVLGFAERNPGITRVLLGDALVGENERLRIRVAKFFDRIETQIKQVLREANLGSGLRAAQSIDATANQLMTLIEGHMSQYVRSNFEKKPTVFIDEQWVSLKQVLFK